MCPEVRSHVGNTDLKDSPLNGGISDAGNSNLKGGILYGVKEGKDTISCLITD